MTLGLMIFLLVVAVSHLTKLLTLLEDMDANAAGAKAQEVMQFEASA